MKEAASSRAIEHACDVTRCPSLATGWPPGHSQDRMSTSGGSGRDSADAGAAVGGVSSVAPIRPQSVPLHSRRLLPIGLFLGVALMVLPGCYSFAITVRTMRLSDGVDTLALRVWVSDQGACIADPNPLVGIIAGLVCYPVNTTLGCVGGIAAAFDDGYDIRWGPVGWFLGVTIPGLTTLPANMRISHAEIEVAHGEIEMLRSKMAQGQGAAVLTTMEAGRWLLNGSSSILAVQTVEPPACR